MAQCPLCNLNELVEDDQRAINMCASCAYRLGVIEMPPALRPQLPCARCNGRKFTRMIPREHTVDATLRERNQSIGAPMLGTHVPKLTKHFGDSNTVELEQKVGYGLLELYACWGCGFVEWYCRDVPRIPIHPHLMTELVDLDASGPYR